MPIIYRTPSYASPALKVMIDTHLPCDANFGAVLIGKARTIAVTTKMTQRRTVEEFGLERKGRESDYLNSYNFLVPFAGPTMSESEWTCQQVEDSDEIPLSMYSINSSKKVYVVFTAFLEASATLRYTEMRLWEMVVANWVHGGHTPDSLRYLGISNIVNARVRQAIRAEWQHQLDQGHKPFGSSDQKMLTITRDTSSSTWVDNYFVRSGLRVAESLSSAERPLTLEKVHLIRIDVNGLYLVLEFKNGDSGQENYRERLIRKLLPMITYNLVQKDMERKAGREWENIIFFPPNIHAGRK